MPIPSAALPELPDLVAGGTSVRPWRLDDLECVRRASADPAVVRGTTLPEAFTADAGRRWIERQWSRRAQREGWSCAIADLEGRAVGCVTVLQRRTAGVLGVGYWVVPAARRAGHAARAIQLVRSWALGDGGASRVEAWVEPGNARSVAVLEACAFHYEGRLRSFLAFPDGRSDALVYSSIAADLPQAP